MSNVVKIHGNDYVTVPGRLSMAHEECKQISITTELLPVTDKVVIKATVITPKGTFTGISAANPDKAIEKQSPYEVAETSAVGRALGFAGYGAADSIASADEIVKAQSEGEEPGDMDRTDNVCVDCGTPNLVYKVVKFSKAKYDGQVVCFKCQQERNKVSN